MTKTAEDEDDELAGTATDQVPASPSVASSWVWLVSDCRVTVAVPVWYPLLALAGRPDPRNAPLASTAPMAAAATTTTTPATTQPRRPCRSRQARLPAAGLPPAGPLAWRAGPALTSAWPLAVCAGTAAAPARASACPRASVSWFISSSFRAAHVIG